MSNETNKKTEINLFTAICLVSGNMIGAGALMLPASLAKFGSLSLIGWFITSIGAICLAVVFSKLSNLFPKSGGPYSFAMHIFGKFSGFQMAWSYWIFTWISNVALVVSGLAYMSIFIPDLTTNKILSMSIGIISIILFTILNTFNLKTFSIIQNLITIFKLLPLFLFCIIGLINFNTDALNIPSQFSYHESITQTLAITLWAFIGLESATIPSDKIKNSKRTVGLATIIGVSTVAIIYILSNYALISIVPINQLESSPAPFVEATRIIFGETASYFMAFIGVFCIAGTLHGWTLILGQVPMSAASHKLFPQLFLKKNSNDIPALGIIIGGVLMCIFFLLSFCDSFSKQFDIIIDFSCFAILIPYIYAISAAFIASFQMKESFKSNITFGLFIISAVIAELYTLFAFIGLPSNIIVLGSISIFLSLPAYVFISYKNLNCGENNE